MLDRRASAAVLVLVIVVAACARTQEYELRGQVVAVDPGRRELTVKHEDIRGFMPAMTMPFRVSDPALLEDRQPGDLIRATLVVNGDTAYLAAIESTGYRPMTETSPARPHVDLLEPGEEAPDARFIDHAGVPRRLSTWRGQVQAVTFMYTRCPLPDFCPLMDRHFAALQRAIASDPALKGAVHLNSVSIDPDHDTPPVLAAHAGRVAADAAHWTFLTGEREEIDRFASRFGVSVMRDDDAGAEIVHNLRTAVIDRDGRLVKVFGGNDWTPAQVLAELKAVAGR